MLKLGGTLRKLDTTSRKDVWTATRVGKLRYRLCQESLTDLGSTWPAAEAVSVPASDDDVLCVPRRQMVASTWRF